MRESGTSQSGIIEFDCMGKNLGYMLRKENPYNI